MLTVRYTWMRTEPTVGTLHSFVYISARFLEVSGTYRLSSTSGSNGGSVAVYTIAEIKV